MSKMVSIRFALLSALALFTGFGCSEDEEEPEPATCDPLAAAPGCKGARVCEAVAGGAGRCFEAYTIRGRVFDAISAEPIENARVVARDVNGAAVSGVALTNAQGEYVLAVPVARNEDGSPSASSLEVLLRADAHAYATFPEPPRTALPLDVLKATGEPPALQSAATDVGLVPLADATNLGSISGKVDAELPGGTLLVASGGATAIADLKGNFVIFNVPAGSASVKGYLTGSNLEAATVEVAAGATTKDVVIGRAGDATAAVRGSLQFVDPGSGVTSVILAVKDTYDEAVGRGDTPPGLKASDVVGPFEITNVPDGDYVVLAAFDNDGLVRDPSAIGGTGLVSVQVTGGDVDLTESFKVTGALAVHFPGADGEEVVSAPPTFEWEDDSSEKRYSISVFDALGELVWEKSDVPSVSGSPTVTQAYSGPELVPGMIYQFRAISWGDAAPLSSTEDLKGVFRYEPPTRAPDAGR